VGEKDAAIPCDEGGRERGRRGAERAGPLRHCVGEGEGARCAVVRDGEGLGSESRREREWRVPSEGGAPLGCVRDCEETEGARRLRRERTEGAD
jgi:hypothetical protein